VSAARLVVLALVGACASAGNDIQDAAIDGPPPVDAAIDSSINYCTSTDTCANVNLLGSVSGDTGNVKLMANGFSAAWLRIRVTEDDSSFGGRRLKIGLRLTSPSAVGFDVVGYVNTGADTMECMTTLGTPVPNGNVDTLEMTWGELGGANGANDGRFVSIEIKPTSLGCTTSQLWALEIEGNPP
jgi:hypothetical protein